MRNAENEIPTLATSARVRNTLVVAELTLCHNVVEVLRSSDLLE